MDRLRELFAELGFTGVRTYIQSGNVFFDTAEDDRAALRSRIEEHLRQALGYAVPTILRTIPELEQVVARDPFKGRTVTPDMRLCVAFAATPVPRELALPLWSPKRDMELVDVTPGEAYVIWYIINGRPPTAQHFVDKTLSGPVTTRFFHTTAKILEAAKKG